MWLIKEEDLEEKFVKGGGPGGQKVNKSNSKVQITHLPSGIVVDSQYSRSQSKNRLRAREILAMRLEQMEDPENCRLAEIAKRKAKTKANRAKKAAKKRVQQENKQARKNGKSKGLQDEPILDIEAEIDEMVVARSGEAIKGL